MELASRRQLVLVALVVALLAANVYQSFDRSSLHGQLREAEGAEVPTDPATGLPLVLDASTPAGDALDICNFMLYFAPRGIQSNTWLGVKAQQNPNDAWITQEILWEVQPDFVIEAGAASGGGAAYWATVLEEIRPEGKVLSIDIEDNMQGARELPIVQRRVEFLIGSSTSPDIVDEVRRQVDGRPVVVILDSDHSRDHVLAEMRIYSEMVQPGGYMIVQDTNLNGHPVFPDWGPGPMEAVDAFLAERDDFVIDESRERLLYTFHPRGYLKRVR